MDRKSLLPKELEIEFLLRLSVKSLFRLKSVCRNWQSIIGSPSFNTRYSCISNAKDSSKLLCSRKDPSTGTYVISIIDGQTTNKIEDLEWPPFLDEGVENKEEFLRSTHVFGPVNGIYCIFNRLIEVWVGTLVLWNPATKEYKHLFPFAIFPFPSALLEHRWNDKWSYEMRRPYALNIGFGFDHDANDFKVVIISQWGRVYGGDDDRWHARVYSLYADSWRTLCNHRAYIIDGPMLLPGIFPPYPNIESDPEFAHCHLNGIFHWVCEWDDGNWGSYQGILAFHMNADSFQLICGPPLTPREGDNFWCRSAWVLNENLTMVASSVHEHRGNPTGNVQVWIMTEYGVKESWTILCCFGPKAGLSPIGIPNDDQIFFRDEKQQVVSFDFKDHKYKEYGIYRFDELIFHPPHENLGVLKYVQTLVPLNPMYKQDEN